MDKMQVTTTDCTVTIDSEETMQGGVVSYVSDVEIELRISSPVALADLDRVRGVRQVEVSRGLRVDVTLEPDEFADLNNLLRRVEERVRKQLAG